MQTKNSKQVLIYFIKNHQFRFKISQSILQNYVYGVKIYVKNEQIAIV